MTGPAERVNPLERPEDRFHPAPPLACRCDDGCAGCHVAVDDWEHCYERFKKVLADMGTLQRRGLFVAVSGHSRCGKTSLINRCTAWAVRDLVRQGAQVRDISLDNVGQGPGVTAGRRVVMVGQRLAAEARRNHKHFNPDLYFAPEAVGDEQPLLEQYTRAVSDAVRDGAAFVLRVPRTDRAEEVGQYWSGTSRKLLIFAETTEQELDYVPEHAVGDARPLRLRLGFLKRGDVAAFVRARIGVPGRGRTFPDLDVAAVEQFYGDSPMVPIGSIQKLLYNIYDHYVRNPWPDGNMIRAADLLRYVLENPEEPEG